MQYDLVRALSKLNTCQRWAGPFPDQLTLLVELARRAACGNIKPAYDTVIEIPYHLWCFLHTSMVSLFAAYPAWMAHSVECCALCTFMKTMELRHLRFFVIACFLNTVLSTLWCKHTRKNYSSVSEHLYGYFHHSRGTTWSCFSI